MKRIATALGLMLLFIIAGTLFFVRQTAKSHISIRGQLSEQDYGEIRAVVSQRVRIKLWHANYQNYSWPAIKRLQLYIAPPTRCHLCMIDVTPDGRIFASLGTDTNNIWESFFLTKTTNGWQINGLEDGWVP